MRLALAEAHAAAHAGEVPVGAVVIRDGVVIATGRNAPRATHDPTAHAEIVALRAAAAAIGNYRLSGCTLVVTLEPCAMCAGAILHARLARVIYGAADSRAGAAGSAINLFADPRLNHQTEVQAGVLAAECAAPLRAFFQPRRANPAPLREDALRTPDDRFSSLADYPWQPSYASELPSLCGLRLHYIDEGPRGAARSWLLLHGQDGWSYEYRHLIACLLARGERVVAPDLIGFGKSDKPKKAAAHSIEWHADIVGEWIAALDLRRLIIVAQGWGHFVGCALPARIAGRIERFIVLQGACSVGSAGRGANAFPWQIAPFPDDGYRAAQRAARAIIQTASGVPGEAREAGHGIFEPRDYHAAGGISSRAAAEQLVDAWLLRFP